MTPARLRPRAEADLVDRSRHYRAEAGDDVAARFFDAAIDALRALERRPGTGTPRVGELCDIPGLRMRRVPGFPCGCFYFVRQDHVDVVRLLAHTPDLDAILGALGHETNDPET